MQNPVLSINEVPYPQMEHFLLKNLEELSGFVSEEVGLVTLRSI
jgi:hypothetical protein